MQLLARWSHCSVPALTLLLAACPEPVGEDAGTPDGGAPVDEDAGVPVDDAGYDAGRPADGGYDAGPADAGYDAGPADAGYDAGPADGGHDAGPADAGYDAGPADAGHDAGPADAGYDAGPADAGYDAGPADSGYDAGPVDAGPADGGFDPNPPVPGYTVSTDSAPALTRGLASADLNGDMRADLVVGGSGASQIWWGDGDGGFPDASALGGAAWAVHAGDLDGNGRADVALADYSGNTVCSYVDADGGLAFKACYAITSGPRSVAAGPFDDDATVDLVVAGTTSDNVTFLKGAGDGTFSNEGTVSVGAVTAPEGIATADFDEDDDLDFVTANQGSDNVSVVLGNGDGTFQTPDVISVGFGARTVTAADLDGDGHADVITTGGGFDSKVAILYGDGAGSFSAPLTRVMGNGSIGLAVADLNGDGVLDVATSNSTSGNVSVILGQGNRAFTQAYSTTVAGSPWGLCSADFNSDGLDDLAYTVLNPATVGTLIDRSP
jgi:hypothetical protein